jgi:uncharacterized membrane protein (DUF2068 family)
MATADITLGRDSGAATTPAVRPRTLRWIAVFKFGKALLAAGVGLGALRLVDPDTAHNAEHWLATAGWTWLDREWVQMALAKATGMSEHQLHAIGAAAFLFSILFTVESAGLWFGKRWGEWLTVVATASLLPLEIYEVAERFTATRVSALALNVALLIYLVRLLVLQRRRRRALAT